MLKKTLYLGLPLLLIFFLIYYYLGGFNKTEIMLEETETSIIAGYSYRGPYQEEVLQELFFQVKDAVDSGALAGTITVINYDNEFAAGDSIKQLIGVRLARMPLQMPQQMQVDTIPAGKVVRAIIQAHPLVMPHPEDTFEKIINFARKESLELGDISIEQYVSEKQLRVDVPLK